MNDLAKKGLGSGLDALFGGDLPPAEENLRSLPISKVEPGEHQPRESFDGEKLEALADSIRSHGVIQPITVRRLEGDHYQIIAGERRWRAARLAGLTEIPAIIVEADELRTAQYALIENLQREDLDAWEEASAYDRLISSYGLSQEELAQSLGRSRSAVANALRLLELPEAVTELLRSRQLTAGHCRALLGLRNKDDMFPLAQKIVSRNLSVREAEGAVRAANRAYQTSLRAASVSGTVEVDYLAELETRATEMIGRRLKIQPGKRRNILSIEYQNEEDLEELLTRICGSGIIEH